jgi:hypothetical protein
VIVHRKYYDAGLDGEFPEDAIVYGNPDASFVYTGPHDKSDSEALQFPEDAIVFNTSYMSFIYTGPHDSPRTKYE